jgi:hypothetical protein
MNVQSLIWLPSKLAEELVHGVAALPWAKQIHIYIDESGEAGCDVVVDDPPSWALSMIGYAPLAIGVWSALLGLGAIVTGEIRPTGVTEWGVATVLALQWGRMVLASARDRDGGGV